MIEELGSSASGRRYMHAAFFMMPLKVLWLMIVEG
jgi:hypothetical protein